LLILSGVVVFFPGNGSSEAIAMKDAPHEPVRAGKPSEDQGMQGGFGPDRSLLIVDDDNTFLTRLCRSMETRGFTVTAAHSVAEGLAAIGAGAPAFAVIDMRLSDGNGLDVIRELKAKRPDARGIILTGYGNIVTAVTAVKLGAFDYLAKPVDADEIFNALMATRHDKAELPENPMSADRVRWEHIQRIYELCGRNVSETARRLNMHRRTLQRILAKKAPR
jgi:two-component system response regulator RegA